MSAPTTERVRLEFDDGTGIDFATPADALFHICYGKPQVGLRGVTRLVRVTDTDADPRVIDGDPVLVHTEPEPGDTVWDRARLEQLAAAADAHDGTPPLHGEPDKTTIDAVAEIAEEA